MTCPKEKTSLEASFHVSGILCKCTSEAILFLFISFRILTLGFVNVRHSSSHAASASLTEQVGQEILTNLHSDREKIQRARERVSAHMPPAHTHLSILTSVCETVKVLQLVSNIDSIHHFLCKHGTHTPSQVCLQWCTHYVSRIVLTRYLMCSFIDSALLHASRFFQLWVSSHNLNLNVFLEFNRALSILFHITCEINLLVATYGWQFSRFPSSHLNEVNFASCHPSSPTLLYFSALLSGFPHSFSLSLRESPPILRATPPYIQPAKQTGRQTQKRPNTGRGPNPDGTLNAECLKTTTWQWALHRRFQRKSNISFQNGPRCLLRVPDLSFFCFFLSLSLLPMSLLCWTPPLHTHTHTTTTCTHTCTQRALKAVCGAKVK